MNDVDCPSRRPATKECRAWPFENFDPLHTVERVRNAIALVADAVGKPIVIDQGIEAANFEPVIGSETI